MFAHLSSFISQVKAYMLSDFIFLGSKITADGDWSHEIKRRLLLGRKATTNLDSILKSWDTTLSAKVHTVKVMDFPVVMYRCESWTIKKAECQRTDAFHLLCWRRLLRVPGRQGNQPLKFISRIDAEAEAPLVGHLIWRANSLAKTLDAWKDWRQEKGMTEDEMVGWHHQLSGHEFEQTLGDSEA